MQYRTLGRTGVQASCLSLGTMNLGALGHVDQDAATDLVRTALDAGVTVVDTADVYGRGESEEIVGRALAGRRHEILLATKAALPVDEDRSHRGASRRWLTTALDASLRRLGTDHVDLFQVHRWDPTTSDDETLAALTDLQRSGKIGLFGSSSYPAYRIVEAQWAAREHHLRPFVTEQLHYSLLNRGAEADVLPVTSTYGLGVLVWSPLSSGWLSGAVRRGQEVTTNRSGFMPARFDLSTPVNQARLDAVERLTEVARGAGLTLVQLALGFVTAHPGVTSAVIGPRTPEHLRSQLAAADVVLDDDVLDAVDAVVAPGVDLSPGDHNDARPSVTQAWRRRRTGRAADAA